MKKFAPIFVVLLIGFQCFAQIGINTKEPTSTLDVNGSLRVRGSNNSRTVATKIVGVDENGNFVDVVVAKNLILENNTIHAIDRHSEIGDIPVIGIPVVDDVDLIILPGEPNDDRSVIRLTSLLGDMTFTGLKAGTDGQKIWLYPVSGQLTIIPNSLLSIFSNQVEGSGLIITEQYRMIQLIYDGSRSKWIVMDH
jgi:hypothetical protein